MNNQNLKKWIIPNLPYILFVCLFDKAAQAVRLAPGADLSGKLLCIGNGFTSAFASPLPSFSPVDMLIGIAGAILIRLIVYTKGKNAKKYRKGVEYGSARWGNAEDIKPYIDPVFANNVLLTQTERLMMSSRPKQPKYARNKNILVIGGSGSGKTRFFVKPNLMQMHSSYVVTDPKGTVLALMSSGVTDSSLKYHLENAKNHGVTRKEIAAVITHVAFYAGWPKGWAVFHMAKEVWTDELSAKGTSAEDARAAHAAQMIFPIGEPNDAFAQYFVGQSYLAPVSIDQVGIYNVTFEPGCRNNWHIHHADNGGGQILVCVAGRGYYQEWGKDATLMKPGDCINIPAGVKHWHGAAPDSWFSHLAIEVPGENGSNEWLEALDDEQYGKLK